MRVWPLVLASFSLLGLSTPLTNFRFHGNVTCYHFTEFEYYLEAYEFDGPDLTYEGRTVFQVNDFIGASQHYSHMQSPSEYEFFGEQNGDGWFNREYEIVLTIRHTCHNLYYKRVLWQTDYFYFDEIPIIHHDSDGTGIPFNIYLNGSVPSSMTKYEYF
ncbi:unnamed protein product [Caenorhabditis sp. 36 PRJEB53466]|nr:unnamed protein product [Caenorhabditis sp. 36 PRJEB53466]